MVDQLDKVVESVKQAERSKVISQIVQVGKIVFDGEDYTITLTKKQIENLKEVK
jgi:hypothetical protein